VPLRNYTLHSTATVPYFLPLIKYQLSYTRIHACGRKLHMSDRKESADFAAASAFSLLRIPT